MPDFYVGQDYTRRAISGRIGGGTQNALPTVNKVVVAACLHPEPAYNPDAPDVILCGRGQRVSAAGEWLAVQRDPIHVFTYLEPNRWEYHGLFSVKSSFTHGPEFRKWVSRGTRPAADISRVVCLRHLPQP